MDFSSSEKSIKGNQNQFCGIYVTDSLQHYAHKSSPHFIQLCLVGSAPLGKKFFIIDNSKKNNTVFCGTCVMNNYYMKSNTFGQMQRRNCAPLLSCGCSVKRSISFDVIRLVHLFGFALRRLGLCYSCDLWSVSELLLAFRAPLLRFHDEFSLYLRMKRIYAVQL